MSRTTSAPWGRRYGHTSVVDAVGAIYVIGGDDGGNYPNYIYASGTSYQDVWASTDGGARAGLGQGGGREEPGGYSGRTRGY
jgi:hypothetical protein